MLEIIALLLSVVLGVLLIYIFKPKAKLVSLLLTFSGSYLLSITILKLLPEVYNHGGHQVGIFVILGLIFQLVLDFFSKGAEHGHVHEIENRKLPWALFITLSMHAFMEGLPLADHQHHDLLWAIVVHKVPIVMVLVSFLWFSKTKKSYALFFIVFFALMSPLGTVLGGEIPFFIKYQTQINAIVAGVFLHISTIILFESSQEHRFNFLKFSAVLIGILIAVVV